jgi:hypothetical protein
MIAGGNLRSATEDLVAHRLECYQLGKQEGRHTRAHDIVEARGRIMVPLWPKARPDRRR